MNASNWNTGCAKSLRRARGAAWLSLLVGLVVAGIAAGVGIFYWATARSAASSVEGALLRPVEKKTFLLEITERGELESSGSTEVRWEVKSRGQTAGGVAILRIVPEGTQVEKGDFLVELDSSALRLEETQQQILVNTSKAIMVESRNLYDTALISKEEYLQGTFKQEKQLIQSELFLAEENLRRAQEYARYSEVLAQKGYITALQLEADQFAVEKAKNELETARTKLFVLENFTKRKMITQLESSIVSTQAKWKADENSHNLEVQKLAEIQDQIAKCIITAPTGGQVKYAHQRDRRGNNDVVIEEGTIIRERQVIIRLPDPTHMEVKLAINEALIDRVRPGMRASVRIVGIKDAVLPGTVRKINDFSEPTGWFRSNIKEYAAYIRIDKADLRLKAGMTAQVTVHCLQLPDSVQVPVQAVHAHGSKFYCMVPQGDHWEAREVTLGPTNDKFVVVRDNLQPGEMVAMNPRRYAHEGELPEIPASTRQQAVAAGPRYESFETPASPSTSAEPTQLADAGGNIGQTAQPSSSPSDTAARLLARLDTNGDGQISRDEWPAESPQPFEQIDTDHDGAVTAAELATGTRHMRAASQAAQRSPAATGGALAR